MLRKNLIKVMHMRLQIYLYRICKWVANSRFVQLDLHIAVEHLRF